MGTDFWWFFDAAAAALLLVTIFLAGKKGFSKVIVVMIGYVIAVAAGLSISGAVSDFFYDNSVKQTNIKNITSVLERTDFTLETKTRIEGMGYNVRVNSDKLNDVLSNSDEALFDELYKYVNNINGKVVDTKESFTEKMTEGFAEITGEILASELSGYEVNAAKNSIIEGNADYSSVISVLYDGNYTAASTYIVENYTAPASKDIIKIFSFIIIIFVVMIVVRMIASVIDQKDSIRPLGGISEHVLGGALGAVEGVVLLFAAAAAVRACILLGNDEMLLFNSETVDKTIFFRHIFNIMLEF